MFLEGTIFGELTRFYDFYSKRFAFQKQMSLSSFLIPIRECNKTKSLSCESCCSGLSGSFDSIQDSRQKRESTETVNIRFETVFEALQETRKLLQTKYQTYGFVKEYEKSLFIDDFI